MNKGIKIFYGCYLLIFAISLFLFIFGTTYNPTNVRKVTIYSITDETISYIDSVNLDDPIIKTIPKPKFRKYNVEDEIYIDTVKNKVKTLYITPSMTSKIEKIGESALVWTLLSPAIITLIGFIVVIIIDTKGFKRIGLIVSFLGMIVSVVVIVLYPFIVLKVLIIYLILVSILAIIDGILKKKK